MTSCGNTTTIYSRRQAIPPFTTTETMAVPHFGFNFPTAAFLVVICLLWLHLVARLQERGTYILRYRDGCAGIALSHWVLTMMKYWLRSATRSMQTAMRPSQSAAVLSATPWIQSRRWTSLAIGVIGWVDADTLYRVEGRRQ